MRRFPRQQINKQAIEPILNNKRIYIAAVFHVLAAMKEHNSIERINLKVHDVLVVGKQT